MVALNFNASQVAPQRALEPLPTGQYPVVITATEEKPTRAGDGAYLEIEMTITNAPDAKFNGRKVYDRLNLKNKNAQAVEIAYSTLSAICYVTGQIQVQDSAQLHGKPFIAVVIKKERNDEPGTFNNEVLGYKDIYGNDPGKGAPPQQAAQPPQFAPQLAPPPQYAPQPPQGQPAWAPQPPQGQPAWAPQPATPAPAAPPQNLQAAPQYAPAPGPQAAPPAQPAWAAPQAMPTDPAQAPQNVAPAQPVYNGPPAGPSGAAPQPPVWAR